MARLQPSSKPPMPQPPPKAKERLAVSANEVLLSIVAFITIACAVPYFFKGAADETSTPSKQPSEQSELQQKAPPPNVGKYIYKDKTKIAPLNPERISAVYTEKAETSFAACASSGFVDIIQSVANYLGKSPEERDDIYYTLLTVGCFESDLRLYKGVNPFGYAGPFQYGPSTFIEAYSRYRGPLNDYLKGVLSAQTFQTVSKTLDMASFDIQTGRFFVNGVRTSIPQKGPFSDELAPVMDLRMGKVGAAITAFLLAKEMEVKYNYVLRKTKDRLSDVAQLCVDTYGPDFIRRMAHNFGPDGAIKYLTANPKMLVRECSSESQALNNDWYDSTVSDLLVHFGHTYVAVHKRVKTSHLLFVEKNAAKLAVCAKPEILAKATIPVVAAKAAPAKDASTKQTPPAEPAKGKVAVADSGKGQMPPTAATQAATKAAAPPKDKSPPPPAAKTQPPPAANLKVAAKATTAPAVTTAGKPQPKASVIPASANGKPANPAQIAAQKETPKRDVVTRVPPKQAALGKSI